MVTKNYMVTKKLYGDELYGDIPKDIYGDKNCQCHHICKVVTIYVTLSPYMSVSFLESSKLASFWGGQNFQNILV